jgi:hypothetical protein
MLRQVDVELELQLHSTQLDDVILHLEDAHVALLIAKRLVHTARLSVAVMVPATTLMTGKRFAHISFGGQGRPRRPPTNCLLFFFFLYVFSFTLIVIHSLLFIYILLCTCTG